jgi:hypothetical protein
LLGTLANATYTAAGWYPQTAGIVDLPAGSQLNDAQLTMLESSELQVSAGGPVSTGAVAAEQNGGQWVRADNFFYRLNPGESADVTLYATSFGTPLAGAKIDLALDPNTLNNTPPSALPGLVSAGGTLSVTTDADGVATVSLTAADPGKPRGSEDIDGQVYGVRPVLQGATTVNPFDFISIFIWSGYQIPANPTWWHDAWPILQQFANLYPVMKKLNIIDLGNYDSVAAMAQAVAQVLSLPTSDPGYMPVTRDLSSAKRQMLLNWLATTGGPNGGPNVGTQPSHVQTVFAAAEHAAKELLAGARAAVRHPAKAPRRDHEHFPSSVAYEYGAKPVEYDDKEAHDEEPHGKA